MEDDLNRGTQLRINQHLFARTYTYRVSKKKVFYKSEGKMHKKMKITW